MKRKKKLVWHHNNQVRALREGWRIAEGWDACSPGDMSSLRVDQWGTIIQEWACPPRIRVCKIKLGERRLFPDTDTEAQEFVADQAEAGSEFHKLALAYIAMKTIRQGNT